MDETPPPVIPLRDSSVTSREQDVAATAASPSLNADEDQFSPPQTSQIQSSINEENSSPGRLSNFVSSASVEPTNFTSFQNPNSAFARLQNFSPPSSATASAEINNHHHHHHHHHHTLPLATIPEQPKLYQNRSQKPLFGVDPIGRLLSFNTGTNTTEDEKSDYQKSNRSDDDHNDHNELDESAAAVISTPQNERDAQSQEQQGGDASVAKSSTTAAESIVIGSPNSPPQKYQEQQQVQKDPNAPVVVSAVSVAQRRRMAAALRAPIRNNTNNNLSINNTPSSIEAYQTSYRDETTSEDDEDDNLRSVSRQSMNVSNNNNNNNVTSNKQHQKVMFSPSSLLGELPSYQSPIAGGDGGMSLVTVLEEYNVIRNCKAWLTETQARSFQSLGTQADQLLDWQRRRLEQQSEAILDDLVSALNPSTIAEMFDAIAGCLDQVENIFEPAFHERISELTSLKPFSANNSSNGNTVVDPAAAGGGTKALSSYVNLLSLEADRILDLASNIHVQLDSLKADLAEARSADASFDVDRKQSRRNFSQKVAILEDESRQLKLDLRREMKVSLDRDRKSQKKFDKVHGQLEALLKGAEMFDEIREDLADTAQELEAALGRTIGLRLNHNKEMTAAQESENDVVGSAAESPNSAPSPNSKAGIQFYQRVAAVSRKIKDHGFDLAAMMSPSAQKEREYTLKADGSVKLPTVYQKTNTACFVDPSIVFATENAKDLGAIEDIADEFFAPMAMEAYDQRRGRSGSADPHDDDKDVIGNYYSNNSNNNTTGLNKKLSHPSATTASSTVPPSKNINNNSNNNGNRFATPPVPLALSTTPATVDHLEQEAKEQAAEILEEARKRTEIANQILNEARRKASVATGTPLLPFVPQLNLQNERPRLPSAAIPDAPIDSVNRIRPNSPPNQSPAMRSATSLRDLVPAPLRGFLPKENVNLAAAEDKEKEEQEEQEAENQKENDDDEEEEEEEEEEKEQQQLQSAQHLNRTPLEESLNKPQSQQQNPSSYQNPKRPRKGSSASSKNSDHPSLNSCNNNNNNINEENNKNKNDTMEERENPKSRIQTDVFSKPGELPVSVSYKVGMPFGTTGTVAGEESTLPGDKNNKSRSSSAAQDDNDNNNNEQMIPAGDHPNNNNNSGSKNNSRSNCLSLSEARRRRKEEKLKQQQKPAVVEISPQRLVPMYSPYVDRTPPGLRGFPTPNVQNANLDDDDDDVLATTNNDIAYVSAPNHTGTPGTTDHFYYPHHQQQQQPKKKQPTTTSPSTTSSSLGPKDVKPKVDSNNHRPRRNSSQSSSSSVIAYDDDHHIHQQQLPPKAPATTKRNRNETKGEPSIFDEVKTPHDEQYFYGDLDDYDGALEDYGETDPESRQQQQQQQVIHVDLTGSGGNNNKKPPPRGVPKPATFSKGVLSNRKGNNNTPTSTRSHIAAVAAPTQNTKKQQPIVANIDLSQYAPPANKNSKGVPYEDQEGLFERIDSADDISSYNNNNNNSNNNNRGFFSNPASSVDTQQQQQQQQPALLLPRSSPANLPTWIDLMNKKTNLQAQFNLEYMDIARYRLEQERNNSNNNNNINNNSSLPFLDKRNYELLPSVGLNRQLKEADAAASSASRPKRPSSVSFLEPSSSSNSKLAGIPMVISNPTPSQLATAPISLRTARVPAFVVPPAPKRNFSNNYNNNNSNNIHNHVDNLGTQEDIRRHLDRLKLDQQEALAKFRNSSAVQNIF